MLMRLHLAKISLFLLLAAAPCLTASPDSDIRAVLATQVEAWNRGDIPTFMTTYSEDCVFVGKKITRGRAQLLERYRRDYSTPASMGHLKFSDLEVHLAGSDAAFVTAAWHLSRSASGGGDVGGLFSLVLRRESAGWKIALDHTS